MQKQYKSVRKYPKGLEKLTVRKSRHFSVSNDTYDKSDICHYLSLFPQRSLIMTGIPAHAAFYDDYCEQISLPIDIITKFFMYEPLLMNNIVSLLPNRADDEFYVFSGHSPIFHTDYFFLNSMYNEKTSAIYEDICTLDDYGKGISILKTIPQCITIALPFIKTERIEDVIDFTTKYEDKFKQLNQAIARITMSCKNSGEIEKILLKEMDDAVYSIASQYKIEKKKLAAKGIIAIVGVCFTLVPIGLSNFFNFDPTIASSVIGSTNLISLKPALEKYIDFRIDVSNQPFWVLWKWIETQNKKTKK